VASGKETRLRAGTQVAVYGLRRTDGVIVASLIERGSDGSRFGPAAGEARMVVNAAFDRSRGLKVDSAQAIGQGPGAPPSGGGNPHRSPGGSILHPNRGATTPDGGHSGAPGVPAPGSCPGPTPSGSSGPSGLGGLGSPGGAMGPGGGGFGGGPGGGMGGGRR
jgi:hypothetical protein